ncbi:MAG: hypothetical protein KatS3mg031_1470 [Chitinophagales bacterium]|nr:MAG: hypothetical protein KatS3mg031_1470 [Chitinophagales bacterium]
MNNPSWIKHTLLMAGAYNILWGIFMLLTRQSLLDVSASAIPSSLLRQGAGLTVIMFGIVYFITAVDPFRHWLAVVIGLLFKIISSALLTLLILKGAISSHNWLIVAGNGVIWVVPFTIILLVIFEHNRSFYEQLNYFYSSRVNIEQLPTLTNKGASLLLLSENNPVMLVFLRHFGCSFCREALRSLARDRSTIEALGTKIVLVHMVSDKQAHNVTARYGLADLHRISDPDKKLYRAFALESGSFRQLLGLKVLIRGLLTAIIGKNLPGMPQGDPAQLPGVFLIYKGNVVKSYRHHTAADTPDYILLANCETCL